MTRRLSALLLSALLIFTAACREVENPYTRTLNVLSVRVEYPSDFSFLAREGVAVTAEDINLGNAYTMLTDALGVAAFKIPDGLYRISVSDKVESDFFNGTRDRVAIGQGRGQNIVLPLNHSRAGSIVIKEIYCGGCKILPQGQYQYDKYIILHNNDNKVQYLDGLCFGSLYPYNSNAANSFLSGGELPDFLPVIQAIWQFGGEGDSFPLQPGEDAVVSICGAIDHSQQYPLSVNLNRPDCFVCYNTTYFPNTTYHPAPGNLVSPERILNVVCKMGRANAYTFSINSPAVVLFRPIDISAADYAVAEGSIIQVPGGTDDVMKIMQDWVVDAVEVFNGSGASNSKRLLPSLDAGYVTLSGTYLGHTLMRRVDEALSASSGYEVLCDTNNSSEDFYESEIQSLHE